MASEVGQAWVSLLPSARGFSKLAQREIKQELRGSALTIPVTPEVDKRALTGLGALTVPARVELDRSQVTAAMVDVTRRERLTVDADVPAGGLIRSTRAAVAATEATNPTIEIGTDVDRDRLRRSLTGAGGDASDSGRQVGSLFTSAFGSTLLNPLIGIPAAIAAVLAFPALSAATAAVTLAGAGLGAIFGGAFALHADPVLQQAFSGFTTSIGDIFRQAAAPLRDPLVQGLDTILNGFQAVAPDLRRMFAGIAPFIQPLADGVRGFIEAFTPGLVDAVIASGPVLTAIANALPDLGAGLASFLTSMAAVAPQAATFIGMFIRGLGDIIRILGVVILVGAKLFGFFAPLFSALWSSLKFGISLLSILGAVIVGDFGAAKRWLGQAISDIGRWWAGLWGGAIPRAVSGAIAWLLRQISGLRGRIAGAAGNLGGLLYQAGRNVVQGLINGIFSMFGSLANAASGLAQTVRNYLPFSPAKEGPLSGSGNPFNSGQQIARMLAGGMESQLPAVSSASSQLAGAVGVGARAAGATSAPQLSWAPGASGDRILDAFRDLIRVDFGGNVQAGLGSGA